MNNKKGISPLIATVLIIGFTILLAVMVVNFIINITNEQTEETECEAAAQNQCIDFLSIESYEVTIDSATNRSINIVNFAIVSANFLVSSINDTTGETIEVNQTTTEIGTGESASLSFAADITKAKIIPLIDHTTSDGISCKASCVDSSREVVP